ncbi:hypothetical protein Cl131_gp065 [Aphanizomenon phage vB_AphaS-CL131]|nr:hypothetical protein Cl131_gp065 [Aphanizomenon phage vB_AphaS-CL131]
MIAYSSFHIANLSLSCFSSAVAKPITSPRVYSTLSLLVTAFLLPNSNLASMLSMILLKSLSSSVGIRTIPKSSFIIFVSCLKQSILTLP